MSEVSDVSQRKIKFQANSDSDTLVPERNPAEGATLLLLVTVQRRGVTENGVYVNLHMPDLRVLSFPDCKVLVYPVALTWEYGGDRCPYNRVLSLPSWLGEPGDWTVAEMLTDSLATTTCRDVTFSCSRSVLSVFKLLSHESTWRNKEKKWWNIRN